MKLGDIYYRIADGIRQFFHLFRYNPLTEEGRRLLAQELQREGIRRAENIEVPNSFNPQSQNNTSTAVRSPSEFAASGFAPTVVGEISRETIPSTYEDYRCISNDPLICHQLQETLQAAPKAKFCSKCGFPLPLVAKQEIRGNRGIYQIRNLLGKRGMGRLYNAIRQHDSQAVEIKEYLLANRSFSDPEAVRYRQEVFLRVSNIRAADGKTSDFRLLFPTEGIADREQKRCYLIFQQSNLATLPTLNTYLKEQGAMSDEEVLSLFDRSLQSLEYLHNTKFQYSSGQIQTGLIHGNINLDSILVAIKEQQFFVYLSDFCFWEELFDPNKSQISNKTIAEDLKSLGKVGFYALSGGKTEPRSGQLVDPENSEQWPDCDRDLKNFILKLLEINSPFENTKIARLALRDLRLKNTNEKNLIATECEEEVRKPKFWKKPLIAVSILAIVFGIGWLIFSANRKEKQQVSTSKPDKSLVPYIKDIPEVPEGKFTFTTVKSGVSNYVFLTKLLQARTTNVIEEIENRQPNLSLNHVVSTSKKEAIAKIDPDRTQFALISSLDGIERDNLDGLTIAHDGIVVFVPYTSKQRPGGLAAPLEGRITIEQLRSLYTGKIKNWQEIGGPDREVKLFVPNLPEAIRIFRKLVFDNPNDLAVFDSLLEKGEIEKLRTIEIIRTIYQDFEKTETIGGIGFGFISQVFDQCSIYPLALAEDGNLPIQTLIESNTGQPISPKTNLCIKGGYYRVDERVFQNQEYPLAFPVSVIYLDDNKKEAKYQIGRKFAQMLTTEEGQCLLKEVFLVPLKPLNNCNKYKNNN
ncbi:MAG: hypothetical protein QNJ38_22190 [Prochloraceae cyanobacterium]|nr:hypothetical protein [Prochloraceae cyanobacterium]